MAESLRALLRESIDYAGTFPPASLSLEQAARNYRQYRSQTEAWMLGRLVWPASQLAALGDWAPPSSEPLDANTPRAVSAVLSGGLSAVAWRETVDRELALVRRFRQSLPIDVLEARLPADRAGQASNAALEQLLEVCDAYGTDAPRVFLELPGTLGEAWDAEFLQLVEVLDDVQSQLPRAARKLGFKLRTGGTTAESFPSTAQLATVICALRDARLHWKATAGLHHPLAGRDEALGVRRHGFINVSVAAAMAETLGLQEADVESILDDEDPGDFQFAGAALSWQGISLEVPQIEEARRRSFASFGSCSFDEPRDDLRALGWL